MVSEMRKGNFNRVERAERVEKGLGVSSQELGLAAKNAKSAKDWPMVRLGDVCEIKTGKKDVNQGNPKGKYPFFTCARTPTFSDTFSFDCEALLIAGNGDVGFTQKYIGKFEAYQRTYVLSNFRDVDIDFLYCILVGLFRDYAGLNRYGSSMPYIKMGVLKDFIFPLPPIEVQKEIVERLEKELGEADKVAAEFKRMVELADKEFKAELDETFGGLREKGSGVSSQELGLAAKNAKGAKDWPMVRLGDVCKNVSRLKTIEDSIISYIDISSIDRDKKIVIGTKEYERSEAPGRAQQVVVNGDVLVSTVRPNLNAVAIVEGVSKYQRIASTGFCVIRSQENILPYYVYYFVQSKRCIGELVTYSEKASYPSVTDSIVKYVQIPLPSVEVQKEVVAKLDAAKERCEKLKAEAERGLRAAENLRKAILSEAFE